MIEGAEDRVSHDIAHKELEYAPVLDINKALCVRISEVTVVRWTKVDLRLGKREDARHVLFVCKDTRRQTRDDLFTLVLMGKVQNMVVDQNVVTQLS